MHLLRRDKRRFKHSEKATKVWALPYTILLSVLVGLCLILVVSRARTKPVTGVQVGVLPNKNRVISLNPLDNISLFVDPNSNAARQAKEWRLSQPKQAAEMDKLSALPSAKWFTSTDSLAALSPYLASAKAAKATPILVVYNLPLRDCGRYSSGGAHSAQDYNNFIQKFADTIGKSRVIIVLEPDALLNIKSLSDQGKPCLSNSQQQMYYTLLQHGVITLKKEGEAMVYIDGGNAGSGQSGLQVADRLKKAGIADADGFSLNVSNFATTSDTIVYGRTVAGYLDNKHFIIDTSRNGVGAYTNTTYPEYSWCNPPGRALGHYPTTATGDPLVDAYLYIKNPGESDGQDSDANKCSDGPPAGVWWPEYALGLIDHWPKELQPK